MTRFITGALTSLSFFFCIATTMAGPVDGIVAGDQTLTRSKGGEFYLQVRQCQQRQGPFATQSTAWQRWRQARSQGYSVSNGVTPCYQYGTRGYCFFVFYAC